MSDLLRQAVDRGTQLLLQGKLHAALEQFQAVLAKAPHDLGSRQKVAEILVKLGRPDAAVAEYTRVSEAYAYAGHFYKAVAIYKLILSIDPRNRMAQESITRLYSSGRQPTPSSGLPIVSVEAEAFSRKAPPPPPEEVLLGDDVIIDVEEVPEPTIPPATGPTLPDIPLFSALAPGDFKAVLNGAVDAQVFYDGEVIVQEGDPGTSMYAIVQGSVRVMRTLEGRASAEVARMGEGEIFGEIALVTGGTRLATVAAVGEVIVLEFQRAAMAELIAAHPGIGQVLEQFLRERLLENLLRASPIFRMLPGSVKAQLTPHFQPHAYAAGVDIVKQGEPGDGVYMILRGTCQAFDGDTGTLYPDLHEGDYFGELSVLLRSPATATVRASTAVTALRLPAQAFLDPVMADPQVASEVLVLARQRFARSEKVRLREKTEFDRLV